jgi:hypothetical protein
VVRAAQMPVSAPGDHFIAALTVACGNLREKRIDPCRDKV